MTGRWVMCPSCGKHRGVRLDGRFAVHKRYGWECPGSGKTVAELMGRAEPARRETA